MSDAIIPSVPVRHVIARLIAKHFLVHLMAELQKPDEVLQKAFKEIQARELTRQMIGETRREFAIGEEEPLPNYNLYKMWCETVAQFRYEEFGFVGYNRIFLPRLLDLRDGTPESRNRLLSAMRATFDSFDYERQGFTVAFFLDSESVMRELLLKTVRENLPALGPPADEIVLNQSRRHQTAMYQYFESVLKTALAENVRLLQSILPQKIASELKRKGFVRPVHFENAAVLFTDFEYFSQFTAHLAPEEVVSRLDAYFTEFDRIIAAHGLEKIKTIGDSYMAVAGVPEPLGDPVRAACDAALQILEAAPRIADLAGSDEWHIRIGIHAGPLVAGVIGKQKFSYDVWGATVNFASRMESSGEPGRINVSAEVHSLIEPYYIWEPRGLQPVKRLGMAKMFFLLGKRPLE
jgi:class 3 adenylate cyclase